MSSSKIESQPMQVKFLFDPENEHTIDKFFISNLNVAGLSRLDNVQRYRSLLPQMIEVFDEQQQFCGIDNLIMKCTLDNTTCLDALLPPTAIS
ncbi:hypothetical protein [Enterobacter roggenkampii]|uniref:hypothetical protein n=1 Tax=Enterobacter roggenkampii TaxID=1812935 RepID=UPI002FE54C79